MNTRRFARALRPVNRVLAALDPVTRRATLATTRARFRRNWHTDHPPHYSDFDWLVMEWAFARINSGSFNRAFHAADVIRPGDRLLDIGCGDGFATGRVFADRCASVDGLDIEPTAIAHAKRRNARSNVTYWLRDAVAEPFPRPPYDVVVWDGAIGHFPAETTQLMLAKIRAALAPDGVFVGSEALGRTEGGYDHLAFFGSLDDLAALLHDSFPHVRMREAVYEAIPGLMRREGYWRASVDSTRLDPWR